MVVIWRYGATLIGCRLLTSKQHNYSCDMEYFLLSGTQVCAPIYWPTLRTKDRRVYWLMFSIAQNNVSSWNNSFKCLLRDAASDLADIWWNCLSNTYLTYRLYSSTDNFDSLALLYSCIWTSLTQDNNSKQFDSWFEVWFVGTTTVAYEHHLSNTITVNSLIRWHY